MRLVVASLLLPFLVACAATPVTAPTVPVRSRVELGELPKHPKSFKLPEEVPAGDWVAPQGAGDCITDDGHMVSDAPVPCPAQDGIVVSEERAWRDAQYRIAYEEMRTHYVQDRLVWAAQREVYEVRLDLASQRIRELNPSWWDNHKLEIGFFGGVVVTVIGTVAVAVAVSE